MQKTTRETYSSNSDGKSDDLQSHHIAWTCEELRLTEGQNSKEGPAASRRELPLFHCWQREKGRCGRSLLLSPQIRIGNSQYTRNKRRAHAQLQWEAAGLCLTGNRINEQSSTPMKTNLTLGMSVQCRTSQQPNMHCLQVHMEHHQERPLLDTKWSPEV